MVNAASIRLFLTALADFDGWRPLRTVRLRFNPRLEQSLVLSDEHIEQTSRAMKAMSHPLRLKILAVLGDREVSVQDIVEQVGTSQSNISQHLAIMRDKGVLRTRKDANRVYYRVGDLRTLEVLRMMHEVFCGFGG